MKTYTLPFATIFVVAKNLIEISVHEGFKLDRSKAFELNRHIENLTNNPTLLIINRINSASCKNKAIAAIGDFHNSISTTVITINNASYLSSAKTKKLPNLMDLDVTQLKHRDLTIDWLASDQ